MPSTSTHVWIEELDPVEIITPEIGSGRDHGRLVLTTTDSLGARITISGTYAGLFALLDEAIGQLVDTRNDQGWQE